MLGGMEKPTPRKRLSIQIDRPKPAVWDCGSALYDSFELKSFERQLNSAIVASSRSLSMPHLTDRRIPTSVFDSPEKTAPPPARPPMGSSIIKKPSKISRSLHKLLRSIFRRPKHGSSSVFSFGVQGDRRRSLDGFYGLYDKSGALTTIPEAPETDHLVSLSPEMNSLARRTASERFTAASVAISCA